jgi:hypothetical protein
MEYRAHPDIMHTFSLVVTFDGVDPRLAIAKEVLDVIHRWIVQVRCDYVVPELEGVVSVNHIISEICEIELRWQSVVTYWSISSADCGGAIVGGGE